MEVVDAFKAMVCYENVSAVFRLRKLGKAEIQIEVRKLAWAMLNAQFITDMA